LLASSVVVGKVSELGKPEAAFYDLPPRPAGRSPDFDGWVVCKKFSQMQDLQNKLRDDLVVSDEMVLGDVAIDGVQVRGWVLTDMGYVDEGGVCCGTPYGKGKKKEPRHIPDKAEFAKILEASRVDAIGDIGTSWMMRFRLPDHEFQVAGSAEGEQVDPKFNPIGRGFAKTMLEEVALQCICLRVWKFPCVTTQEKSVLCRMPLYAQKHESAMKVSPKSPHQPIQVVMSTRPSPKAWS
jgi:hypothetical protein